MVVVVCTGVVVVVVVMHPHGVVESIPQTWSGLGQSPPQLVPPVGVEDRAHAWLVGTQ